MTDEPTLFEAATQAFRDHGLTAAITARIEESVRADPAQWLWIHNRWPTARDAELMRGGA